MPSLARSACSVLMQTATSHMVFDIGPGTMRRLTQLGVPIHTITHVYISHFHPDHTGELVTFLFANKFPEVSRRRVPLQITGGPGFMAFWQGLQNVFGNWIDLGPDRMTVRELDFTQTDYCNSSDFQVRIAPVNHVPESTAYRITGPDQRTVVYSGDTDECDTLVELARSADLFICEAALPDELKVPGHLTPSLAGALATRAKVRQLVLTHFYPECETVDMVSQCRQTFAGPLVLAQDLLTL